MKKLNRITILIIISIIMLFIALLDLPYGYYQILRWVICGTTGYIAHLYHEKYNEKWTWIFGGIAILFNPIATIHLNREIWSVINIIVAILLIINIKKLRYEN